MARPKEEDRERLRVRYLSAGTKQAIRKAVIGPAFRALSGLAWAVSPLLPERLVRLDRPVFIVGCSRSGTTLLLDMLRQHRDLAEWSEAGQLFDLSYYDPDSDHLRTAADASGFERRRLRVILGLYTRLRGKPRFLNKHPQNSLRMALIKAVFPDARFIHLIRDGRAVIASNVAQVRKSPQRQGVPFGNFPKPPDWRRYRDLPLATQFAHQWVDVTRHVRAAAAALPPEDVLELRYEAFCDQPHALLRQVDTFLGLDLAGRDLTSVPERFSATIGSWERTFTEDERRAILDIAAPLLDELGYRDAAATGAPASLSHPPA